MIESRILWLYDSRLLNCYSVYRGSEPPIAHRAIQETRLSEIARPNAKVKHLGHNGAGPLQAV